MKKKIKLYGDTLIMSFNKEEQEVYDIHVGDIFDIEMVKMKRGKKNVVKRK